MGTKHLSSVKSNATFALTFYWYIISVLAKTKSMQLKLIHIFATVILLMKKLEIEKIKPTIIISVLKDEY